jgi:hypothetical protein
MKRYLMMIVASCVAMSVLATEKTILSPQEKIKVTLSDAGGRPTYTVAYEGKTLLLSSPLGVVTPERDFSTSLTLVGIELKDVRDHYRLRNIKQSEVDYQATEAVCRFRISQGDSMDVVFRLTDRDVAYCYRLYPAKDRLREVIQSESSGFRFPQGTTTFLCPQVKPMGGFASTYPSYETNYTCDDTLGKNGWGEGYTFPCLFKVGTDGWALVSETGVGGNYCGSRLIGHRGGLYTIGFPQPGEGNGLGSVEPGMALPGQTPWRTITVGRDLANIVETTVPFDLVEQLYPASREYVYGKGSWSWIIGMDASCNFDEQKRYIDFSAAMGYNSVLVDALWDTRIGREGIRRLADYGRTKGVSLYLWYNSNGYWNDAPQGPRGIMSDPIKRKAEMKWMQQTGIRGIKVDFFGGDKQDMLQRYEQILSDANDYGLLCIFHGCTLPRGWERMYPNFAASEAVLASENLHFSQEMCDAEARNACIHPFVRNTVGSMDFGGSALNKFYNANNRTGSQRRTSDVFALATAVLFQSPVQHFALAPNNLTDAPAWAIEFMKQVPTTWDETKYIDGYPGKYVIMARRHAGQWYIVGINAEKEPLKRSLTLPMLASGSQLTVYSDSPALQGNVKSMTYKRKVNVTIPQNGGVVIVAQAK